MKHVCRSTWALERRPSHRLRGNVWSRVGCFVLFPVPSHRLRGIVWSRAGCFVFVFRLSHLVLSVDKRVSQILNGHTGTFAKIKVPGRAEEAQVRCPPNFGLRCSLVLDGGTRGTRLGCACLILFIGSACPGKPLTRGAALGFLCKNGSISLQVVRCDGWWVARISQNHRKNRPHSPPSTPPSTLTPMAHAWPQVLCFEEKKADSPAKLYVMEVGRDKDAPGGVFRLSPQQIPNAADAPNDFPVAMQVGEGG